MFRFLAEYAAEFIPQQIGLLQAARIRKAKRGFYVGLGNIARGYIVDYDKDSPTYRRLVPYEPYIQPVLDLFERFYALEANLAQLCREVEGMPFVFPEYELWVDKRNIRDKKFKRVQGGYHLTRRGLLSILTNPVYIGWLILNGDIISMNNHTALIPPEKRYLFWYAFDALSEFTTKERGSVAHVAQEAKVSQNTIRRGIREVEAGEGYRPGDRQREKGGWRKKASEKDATLLSDLEGLLEPKGDPMSLLKWTSKSVAHLKGALQARGHTIADTALRDVLLSLGYSLRANKKNIEGASHQDRDAQFTQIKTRCEQFERQGNPIISVDCKKKELIGTFKNNGAEWQAKGEETMVNVYDFLSLADGKAIRDACL